MDNTAPITWLVGKVNQIISSGAESAAASITNTIMPLVSIGFGIYILLILINYLRGAEDAPVIDFLLRIASFGVIVTMGLNADVYAAVVLPIVTGLGGDLANAISGAPGANMLDQLALHYLKIINNGFAHAANLDDVLEKLVEYVYICVKAAIILLGLIPFLVAATVTVIIADVGITLVAMVGPIFFACLLFPATRQYFSAWVNTCFSYALIPLFVAVVATLSVGISHEMLSAGGSLNKATFTSVFFAAIANLILLFILRQVSSLASSLSAGGINAAMPGGIGSIAKGANSSFAGSVRDIENLNKTGKGAGKAMMYPRALFEWLLRDICAWNLLRLLQTNCGNRGGYDKGKCARCHVGSSAFPAVTDSSCVVPVFLLVRRGFSCAKPNIEARASRSERNETQHRSQGTVQFSSDITPARQHESSLKLRFPALCAGKMTVF